MTKKAVLPLFLAAALILISSCRLTAADCVGGAPLEIINRSGSGITGLYISQTGMNKWSENRISEPVKEGGTSSVDIGRNDILGISDVKIELDDGREVIWHRMPVLEIFSVTVTDKAEPVYEQIKLSS
ncbi:MAG: hypothetical protein IKT09_05730 [Synergistes sp.]|nr:hypothetical protein [Synergistes sp.]